MAKIHEYLGVPASWPIRENIKHEIVLVPTRTDVRTAKQKDPRGCALHNAACRMYDVPNCCIGSRYSYIPQRDPKGRMYIARVQATYDTRRAIREFDKTGKMPEAGFRFIAVNFDNTLKRNREKMREWMLINPRNQNKTKRPRSAKKVSGLRTLGTGIRG